jgi:hypothetical protein
MITKHDHLKIYNHMARFWPRGKVGFELDTQLMTILNRIGIPSTPNVIDKSQNCKIIYPNPGQFVVHIYNDHDTRVDEHPSSGVYDEWSAVENAVNVAHADPAVKQILISRLPE